MCWGRAFCVLFFAGRISWCVLGCGNKFCVFIPVEETVLFSCGENPCLTSGSGGFPSLVLRDAVCVSNTGEFALHVCLLGEGGCLCIGMSVFGGRREQERRRGFLLQQPLSTPAGWSQPRASRSSCRLELAPAPWRRAPLAAAARPAAPPAGSGASAAAAPADAEPFLSCSGEVKEPFRPSDLALCLRRPLPRFWPLPHLSLLPPTLECKVLECSLLDHDRPIPRVGTGWTLCHWEARRLAYLDPAPHLSELPHLLFSWDSSFEIKSYAVNAAFRLFVPRFLRPFIPRAKTKLTGFGGGERKEGTLWCVGPRDFR